MSSPVKLAVFAPSPVFYQVPLYRLLAADPRLDFTAIFASNGGTRPYEGGYGKPIMWDVDLLSGYRQIFLRKADTNPIGGTALGIRDPDVVARVGEGRYDVLWLQGYATITHLLAALRQKTTRRTLMFREEQTLLHPRPLWKTLLKEPLLRGLLAGSYALYIGTENRRWFERYGVPAERRFSVPYVVDNDALRAEAAELAPRKDELRASFGIAADAGPVILSVSRLIPKKQPLFLLEAFQRVRETRRCMLLVVGSGECEPAMREYIERRRIPDVVFTGFMNRSEIPRAYASADVFALASRIHETWGIVVNEAMNFDLPLVLSDKVGSATDLLEPGRNGFRFAADDPADAASALGRLVDDPELRAVFGARSREIVGEITYRCAADGLLAAVAHSVGPCRWAEASRAGLAHVTSQSGHYSAGVRTNEESEGRMSDVMAGTERPASSADGPACPVCGSTQAAVLEPVSGWGDWYVCPDCTLEFVEPLVLPVTPQELYGAAYRGERSESGMREFNDRVRQRRAIVDKDPTLWFWSPAFGRIIEWLHRRVGRGENVFEVGCGLGFFMHALRREGFDVAGLDVADKPVELNRGDGFRVWHGEVDTVPEDWVDPEAVVCMFMLHHVLDPIALLSAIRTKWPRAALAIAQYGPSNQGTAASHPPRTLTRWSALALETALARAGYGRVEARELAGTGNEARLLKPVRKVLKQSIRVPVVYRLFRSIEHRVVARVARPLGKPGYVVLAFAEPT